MQSEVSDPVGRFACPQTHLDTQLSASRVTPAHCGFDEDKSVQIHAMLMGRDVHRH